MAQKKPKKGKPGRLPKLTSEVSAKIIEGITAGVHRKYAAERAGIGERTLNRWLAQGRKAKSGPLMAFLAAVKKAQAECIARNVANIQRAASGVEEVITKETRYPDGTIKVEKTVRKVPNWQASAWTLERACPEEYGRPYKPETTDEKKKPTPLVVKGEADPDEL